MFIFDTIVAEATAPFESALSIVRLSGTKTNEILERLTKKSIDQFKPRMTYNRYIYCWSQKNRQCCYSLFWKRKIFYRRRISRILRPWIKDYC